MASEQTDVRNLYTVINPEISQETTPSPSPSIHPPSYSEIPGTVPLSQGRDNLPPPSYDDVVNPNAPPPSYQSLFGQVREARKNSSNVIEFFKKVVVILLGTLGCSIIIGITVIIPVSMIIVGSTYLYDCPVQNYIPVYLLVGGVFGVVKNFTNYYSRCRRSENANENLQPKPRDSIINCFLLAWFIAGCVWIYRVYEPEYEDTTSPFYCNKTVYLFAFWLVTTFFIVIGLMSVCIMCFVVSSVMTSVE